ncbi:hypothetical protein EON65_34255 [archaeon]|nr:MAG: hypothetical protein EON65_34255 [archaeon]
MEPFVDIDDYFDIVQRCQVNGLRAILRRLDSKRADYLLRARNPSEVLDDKSYERSIMIITTIFNVCVILQDNQTALLLAVIMKDEPTVRLLLQEGVDLYDGIEVGPLRHIIFIKAC